MVANNASERLEKTSAQLDQAYDNLDDTSKEIINILDPSGTNNKYVFQSGTVNDGTSALSSTIAALKIYKNLEKQGKYNSINNRFIPSMEVPKENSPQPY